ncbi:Probable RNA-directed DNA polymerase from transposon X-element [Eumeta japonica]|uniref:Probable RNA-directed DNA polymerase from transposon X-element n=1 Tax=Eumeta variegata TaxID=151549 RepID=A0A4C1YR73_EUMVA|nr:Probable RNA-directed DNA polymerase from transposon X-element [Eumeta japonica]
MPPSNKNASSHVSTVRYNRNALICRKELGEILAEHLEEQSTPHLTSDSLEAASHHARVQPKRKVLGPDGISTGALKQLPNGAMVTMTRFFNDILWTRYFLGSWKTGRIIAIPKPGKDPRIASSHRPITLLSHIADLFERIMLRRLYRHLTSRQEQFGFRSGHSNTLQLARILHYMATEQNRGRRTVGIFLVIDKAFDRLWHSGLL